MIKQHRISQDQRKQAILMRIQNISDALEAIQTICDDADRADW